jgi:hypothetical protein
MSRYVPSWLPDGTAELLDVVVSEVSKYIQGGDHLVIVEGYRRSLAEEKDSLEHVHCVLANSCLDESQFPLRVSTSSASSSSSSSSTVNLSESTLRSRHAWQWASRASY